jgi:CRP/FNR family cyclic AMP-dependent transcriptional regulator
MINLPLGKSTDLPIAFKAGTVIFEQGEPSKYLFLVKKGEVRLLKAIGGHITIIQLCKEKDILNEISVLTNKPSEFAAIAKTDVELVLIEQKDILSVIKKSPSWVPEMFETLCERLKSTQEIIEEHHLNLGEKDPAFVISKEEEKKYIEALSKK